jgi:predicted secreted protein
MLNAKVANKHTSSYVEEASKAAERAQLISELVREQDDRAAESPKTFRRGLLETWKQALISPLFVDMTEAQRIRVSSIPPVIIDRKLKE